MENFDYELSPTRRPVVQAAEDLLGYKFPIRNEGSVVLMDYCGGDQSIINNATQFRGPPPGMSTEDFMLTLHTSERFKWAPSTALTHIKVRIECPIQTALKFVYYNRASVNEYSARYSELNDVHYIPSIEEIAYYLPDLTQAAQLHKLLKSTISQNYAAYAELADQKNVGMARELARIITPFGIQTMFYWKVSLEDLHDFFLMNPRPNPVDKPVFDALHQIARALAPESLRTWHHSYNSFQENCFTPQEKVFMHSLNIQPHNPESMPLSQTKRPISPGAEQQLYVPHRVLDHGWYTLTDYMGSDMSVPQAARVSYGKGTKKLSEDEGLIRYLRRHRHSTPTEMVEFVHEMLAPGFVFRQFDRHRTEDRSIAGQDYKFGNELYQLAEDQIRKQSAANKQGRGSPLEQEIQHRAKQLIDESYARSTTAIHKLREAGARPEHILATIPVGSYTRRSGSMDLHNAMHFDGLRAHSHAQFEIQQYAGAMGDVFREAVPISWQAYLDYQKNAVSLSVPAQDILKEVLDKTFSQSQITTRAKSAGLDLTAEAVEFIQSLLRQGLEGKITEAAGVKELKNKRELEEIQATLKKLLT